MSGIDAAQLGDELPGRPLAWNLASTGQSLVESFIGLSTFTNDELRGMRNKALDAKAAAVAMQNSKVRYELACSDDLWPVEVDQGQRPGNRVGIGNSVWNCETE